VHGWDLAVASGQDAEADPASATAVLVETRQVLPAEPRGGPIPFAAPVEPQHGAGPTEQLANWCGHSRGRGTGTPGRTQERGRRSDDIGGSGAGARGVGNDSASPVGT
jgi:hypothetical protein